MNLIAEHYDNIAAKRDKYRKRNRYYHSLLNKQYRYFIPEYKKVLEVGCSTGNLLNFLKPSVGVGVDISVEMLKIARSKYPHLQFQDGEIDDLKTDEKFNFIVLSGLIGEIEDIQSFLESLRRFSKEDTRLVIEYFSYFWQSILKIAEHLHLKIPQRTQNWVTSQDLKNFLILAGYDFIKIERCILFPKNIPVLSFLINKIIAKLPFFNLFCLSNFVVARPIFPRHQEYSTTILVPCRNEKGNIEQAITRTPAFGSAQEFIFVEGHSRDGTYEEVERVMKKYPEKDIKLYRQAGKGKGDAVRLGFSKATKDILMILDADLTVPPEELPKFYRAIRDNSGEFINGSRLVYPMEKESMQFLNLIANKCFGLFFSWLLGQRFKDTLCGTKVMFRHHYEELAANRAYFGDFDPFGDFDLIFGATKMNLKIIELPIHYKSRQYGTTQIQRFQHGLLLLRMCMFAMRKIKFI
ncbi:MAG: glycosyl transferase [Omnitrophica WOR_2 bacterium GWA2_47_8]|nr:MAG: glycosyl transferase [Omnitrophica WOR_2 bacterium GWA2_47_8]